MSIQSYISAYKAPDYEVKEDEPIAENNDSIDEFEYHESVTVEYSEFDNFLVDIRKLPPGVTHIHFWRG